MQEAGRLFESDLDAHTGLPGLSGALPSTNGRPESKLSSTRGPEETLSLIAETATFHRSWDLQVLGSYPFPNNFCKQLISLFQTTQCQTHAIMVKSIKTRSTVGEGSLYWNTDPNMNQAGTWPKHNRRIREPVSFFKKKKKTTVKIHRT